MLYHILYPLRDFFFAFNIFQYISFRAVGAAITALFISFLLGPRVIKMLTRLQVGETIRESGPESHQLKEGTPTMGGALIILAIVLPTLLWAKIGDIHIQILLLATVWMGMIGFFDDYLKVVKKYPDGLIARYKMAGQIILGLIVGFLVITYPTVSELRTVISVPFIANGHLDIGWLYLPLVILVITGTSNAVNLTDGLDGLAIVPVLIVALSFAFISYVCGNIVFSNYLHIPFIFGSGELAVMCGALVGAALGFLWFNAPPAKVFMGDTGALSMGGTLGTLSLITKHEIVLAIIGGLFVLETLSVIIQVLSFKLTGKRIFKMAPIHHHFEKKGWSESTVVIRFWIISIILAMIGLATLKLR